jgi:hypothetical protein
MLSKPLVLRCSHNVGTREPIKEIEKWERVA